MRKIINIVLIFMLIEVILSEGRICASEKAYLRLPLISAGSDNKQVADRIIKIRNTYPGKIKLVVFDFGGVIVNSAVINGPIAVRIYCSIIRGLDPASFYDFPESEIQDRYKEWHNRFFVTTTTAFFKQAIKEAVERGIAPSSLKTAEEYYSQYKEERKNAVMKILKDNPRTLLMPRIEELLKLLSSIDNGPELLILSTATEETITRITNPAGIQGYFSEIVGLTEGQHHGSVLDHKMNNLKKAVDARGADLKEVIFIDDGYSTVKAVRRVFGDSINIIGFSPEGDNIQELIEAGADFIFKDHNIRGKEEIFGLNRARVSDFLEKYSIRQNADL